MEVFESAQEVREWSRGRRSAGRRVGLVPTMGYLHEGHLSLVQRAREETDAVVLSIFVNPAQFGPNEDLARYPRDLKRDLKLCRSAGVQAVFAPSLEGMYPEGFQTFVEVEEIARPLCGTSRPGHFRGVATVVCKLLNLVEPDVAVFGQKDYQQLQVIRRMVRDLDMPVRIVGSPIVREPDGLALSSRNTYLTPEGRERALALSRALARAQDLLARGEHSARALEGAARAVMEDAAVRVDYAEVRDPATLEELTLVRDEAVLALAGFVDGTRLIDNRVLRAPRPQPA